MRVPQTIENKRYENEPQGILCLDIKVMSVKEAKRLRKSSMCFCHREASVVGACRDDAAVGSPQQTSSLVWADAPLVSVVLCQLKFSSYLSAQLKQTSATRPCRYMGFFPLLILVAVCF